MLFIENVKLALTAIRVNKMRSFLTMLGIIIGISSVITITAIGASAQGAMRSELDTFGEAYMAIYVDWRQAGDYVEYSDMFTVEDIEALKARFPGDIKYAERYNQAQSSTRIGRQEGDLQLMGVGAEYDDFYKGIELIHGRMFTQNDIDAGRESIVIDVKAARYFFNNENPVGRTLPVSIWGNERDLTIVGVFDTPPSLLSQMDIMGTSFTCYVPVSLLMAADEPSSYIEIYGNGEKDVAAQGQAYVDYVTAIKDKEPGFYAYETIEEQAAMINTTLGTLAVALGVIAGISLLVGGIGIMNIMLVSVTERTREIGIRKSLGARTRDILTQFLIEAMILSCIGGIVGTATGMSLAWAGMAFAGIELVMQPMAIVIAIAFSAAVGVFFGIFPARKAAKLDPIEALRYE